MLVETKPPQALLHCDDAPARPQLTVDWQLNNKMLARYLADLHFAGEDCRSKLARLRGLYAAKAKAGK